MPELPEVETTRRGIETPLLKQRILALRVRERRLRWPIPEALEQRVVGQTVMAVERRAKYLLLRLQSGTLIVHLGMSGSLRVLPADSAVRKHDHVDWVLDSGDCLRLHDPRRFGAVLWCEGDGRDHPLLASLGPEPLDTAFNADYLYQIAQKRRVPIKSLIMDSKVVVGVGNIYASESLFLARIHPQRLSHRIARARLERLALSITQVLRQAIQQGGSTLRDFRQADGQPGYFAQSLNVYGRTGEPCPVCATPIMQKRIGQRSSFYCKRCQR
jgi:formamidopyrimidine-DNA glycosylase